MTVERTLKNTFTEHHRIDSSPSSYRHYRHVHARRPLGRVVVEVAVVALAKIALLVLIGWLLFAPHANAPVAVEATPHRLAPALLAPTTVRPQAPISTK
ncbi:hypothetical protein HDE76_002908 [Rhodanobacter sp. ANJX3]|uniref:hypothetical protein n=1 Tax=unclassified Rhodanobacter TaxID=2621553 RepID=UPI0015C6B443|nr:MULTISPECIES: hypothetical protein [unclassified Rhodanobacter]MBB5359668.1 hypothetical protein [Rhodanobacter sp. ANJX3]NYE30982.1 hypothetical protein [Rhodanobacter sp. K2T2]